MFVLVCISKLEQEGCVKQMVLCTWALYFRYPAGTLWQVGMETALQLIPVTDRSQQDLSEQVYWPCNKILVDRVKYTKVRN